MVQILELYGTTVSQGICGLENDGRLEVYGTGDPTVRANLEVRGLATGIELAQPIPYSYGT